MTDFMCYKCHSRVSANQHDLFPWNDSSDMYYFNCAEKHTLCKKCLSEATVSKVFEILTAPAFFNIYDGIPEHLCPVCQAMKVTDSELLKFAMKLLDTDRTELVNKFMRRK